MRIVIPVWLTLCAFVAAGGLCRAQSAQTPQPQAMPFATAAATAVGTEPGPPTDATTQQTVTSDLFVRMQKLNATLKTYKADLHVEAELHSFPFVSPSLDGKVYFKQPDSQAVVFDVVPALASQFKKLYAHIEPPTMWADLYALEILGDDGHATTLRLVPRKHGRVSHLDVTVDDTTATITSYRWSYDGGGFIAFDQSFTVLQGNYLVRAQSGHIDLPSYKADVKSTLTHYQLNVPIDDSVFTQAN
jgi:hypothetical protein